jgi:DNA-binding NarL/FixJ family response regulator
MPPRILIADDNPLVRAAMRDVLEVAGGWEIIEAENGEQAIQKARDLQPRLIILDLVMPGKDGLEASRELVDLLPDTPILMHTLYYSAQLQIEAVKSGVHKIVPKSESATLVSAVREVLDPDRGASSAIPIKDPEPQRNAKGRAEDRIRELCVEIVTTANDQKLEAALVELRDALRRHVEQFRARLAQFPTVSNRRLRDSMSRSLPVAPNQERNRSAKNNPLPKTKAQ